MTQEEKDLLLKDLCSRLIYGVKVKIIGYEKAFALDCYEEDDDYKDGYKFDAHLSGARKYGLTLDDFKPYLRPMTDMDENEEWKYNYLKTEHTNWEAQDYLNSIHIDYRGLIKKGLALEAPKGMYNN